MNKYTKIESCPITGDAARLTYLNLGDMPLVNKLNDTREESLSCEKFPLAVQFFLKSHLSTLTIAVDPNILYKNYFYTSAVSKPYTEHCIDMFEFVDTYLKLQPGDNVLDIGGNDGTLLKAFLSKKEYLNVLNIDASENLTVVAQQNGINSINAFWNSALAKKINTKFKLITTTNCFQHTMPIEDFVHAISLSLEDFGIWCLEFPYWKNSIDTNQFDQIYHEHIYYYMLAPIQQLLHKYKLQIIKITNHDIHGGTIRLLISKIGDLGKSWQPCTYSVEQELNKDKNYSYLNKYIEWGKNITLLLKNSSEFLQSLKKDGKTIVGFGAAAKGCVFLNSINVNYQTIDYIIDDTTIKQNKFVPGTGIQILPRSILNVKKPDYILILAHNFSQYIRQNLREYGYKNKFITLLPNEIKIYE
jgi:cyclopropane fatty-acyl-phospholipid synthase-like methyltransferase